MSKEIWHRKMESHWFYIITFRRLSFFLLISFIINLSLGGLICYKYFHQGGHVFYASNGIASPVRLSSRDGPNLSSKAILSTPKVTEEAEKPIPD